MMLTALRIAAVQIGAIAIVPSVEAIDTGAIFRSKCRQADHEKSATGWMARRAAR
jgi:hypothetical protein